MRVHAIYILTTVICCSLFLAGCGNRDFSSSNPVAVTSPRANSTTEVVFRIIPPTPAQNDRIPFSILAQTSAPPTVEFSLQLINSGVTANPVTVLRKTVTATASGTGYTAVATFSAIPLQTVIGEINISGGSLNGATTYRGAKDLGEGQVNVVELAASGSRSLPDLVAQVLETLVSNSTDFAKFTGLLVAQIESAFTAAGITANASYDDAYQALVHPIVGGSANELIISEVSSCNQGATNDGRWIEVYNNSDHSLNLSDYRLRAMAIPRDGGSYIGNTLFSLPSLAFSPGQYVVIRVKGFDTYLNGPRIIHLLGTGGEVPYWRGNGYVELVRVSDNQTVDFVRFGTDTTQPLTATAWSGSSVSALPETRNKSIVRALGLADSNTAGDWTQHSWPTPGGPNDVSNPNDVDLDTDGIPDGCEVSGKTFNGLPLAAWGAQTGRKDVFIHIDYMTSSHPGLTPKVEALDKVVQVFANHGWAIHFDVGSLIGKYNLDGKSHEVPFATYFYLGTQSGAANHYQYKSQYLDLAKQSIFHYCVFANIQLSNSTGLGEKPGNDFFLSLGDNDYTDTHNGFYTQEELNYSLINDQASTLMHEFGHNLGLHHGGGDERNYKPNYLSIMNYLYSGWGLPTVSDSRVGDRYYYHMWSLDGGTSSSKWFAPYIEQPGGSYGTKFMHNSPWSSSFVMDYSSGGGSPALSEANLKESMGLNYSGGAGIDWNGDGDTADTLTNVDINSSDNSGTNTSADTLSDHDDWSTASVFFSNRSNNLLLNSVRISQVIRFSFQNDDHEPVPECRLMSSHELADRCLLTR